jgi:hypothetical protein
MKIYTKLVKTIELDSMYRLINEFKGEYQLRNNLVKDENGELFCRFSHHFKYVEELLFSVTECA